MNAIKREAHSALVVDARNAVFLMYPGFRYQEIPNKQKNPQLHALAKADHVRLCAILAEAPRGFELAGDDRYMYAFHAIVDAQGNLLAFAHTQWDELVSQYRLFLPGGRASTLTLNLLAFLVMALAQSLTFMPDANGELQYGKFDANICSVRRLEDIKSWLLDEDACPTTWAPLLALRRARA